MTAIQTKKCMNLLIRIRQKNMKFNFSWASKSCYWKKCLKITATSSLHILNVLSGSFTIRHFQHRSGIPITNPRYLWNLIRISTSLGSRTGSFSLDSTISQTGGENLFHGAGTAYIVRLSLSGAIFSLPWNPGIESRKMRRMMTTLILRSMWYKANWLPRTDWKGMFFLSCSATICG